MTLEAAPANANYGTSASGSSFYAAMRILPREQREAMFQIYSFCRQVDDIADSDGPRPERLAALQQWRDDIDALYQDRPPARVRDYVASVRRFDLQREDFLAIVDGMEMDVPQDIRAPDLATLDLYCDRVASAVGEVRYAGACQKCISKNASNPDLPARAISLRLPGACSPPQGGGEKNAYLPV